MSWNHFWYGGVEKHRTTQESERYDRRRESWGSSYRTPRFRRAVWRLASISYFALPLQYGIIIILNQQL